MSKFEIHSGKPFSADFTVVSSDGVTGEQLDPTDTATFDSVTNGVNPTCVLSGIPMTIVDADNGTFNLSLTAEQTTTLSQDIGFKEDKYSTLSNYLGYISFVLVSGDRAATVDVYVRSIPACPVTP